jgi:hypothetical protein
MCRCDVCAAKPRSDFLRDRGVLVPSMIVDLANML